MIPLRTGDLGHYDSNGALYYDGRVKDVIREKVSSRIVFPGEVEEAVINEVDGAEEAAVFSQNGEVKNLT